MSKWLVTGGAGYIGSHVVRALLQSGRDVVVIDDLSTGKLHRVPAGVTLYDARIHNATLVQSLVDNVDGVIHLAGKKSVSESLRNPSTYWHENVVGMFALLSAMHKRCSRIVFSSSAAVYGNPLTATVSESSPTYPLTPYGRTKLVGEQMLDSMSGASNLNYVALRYFNVVGAQNETCADTSRDNLVPIVFDAINAKRPPVVFGTDYDTTDGSCVRDYVHVSDIADAHVAAVERLENYATRDVYNVGTGVGTSVLQMLEIIGAVTGFVKKPLVIDRRSGDASSAVADVEKIWRGLGWRSHFTVGEAVESAWHFSNAGLHNFKV